MSTIDTKTLRKLAEAANAPEPADIPDLCVWRESGGERCTNPNEIGGFCFAHDDVIHGFGGDNSPLGAEAIRRSALDEPRPISPRPAWREARLAYIAAANPATVLGLLDALVEAERERDEARADLAALRIEHEAVKGLLTHTRRDRDEARAQLTTIKADHRILIQSILTTIRTLCDPRLCVSEGVVDGIVAGIKEATGLDAYAALAGGES